MIIPKFRGFLCCCGAVGAQGWPSPRSQEVKNRLDAFPRWWTAQPRIASLPTVMGAVIGPPSSTLGAKGSQARPRPQLDRQAGLALDSKASRRSQVAGPGRGFAAAPVGGKFGVQGLALGGGPRGRFGGVRISSGPRLAMGGFEGAWLWAGG